MLAGVPLARVSFALNQRVHAAAGASPGVAGGSRAAAARRCALPSRAESPAARRAAVPADARTPDARRQRVCRKQAAAMGWPQGGRRGEVRGPPRGAGSPRTRSRDRRCTRRAPCRGAETHGHTGRPAPRRRGARHRPWRLGGTRQRQRARCSASVTPPRGPARRAGGAARGGADRFLDALHLLPQGAVFLPEFPEFLAEFVQRVGQP